MAYSENNSQRRDSQVHYEIREHIGVLNKKDSGWTREVNVVAWNDKPPKVDIREWGPDHVRMSRGVTLLEEEAERMTRLLARRYGLTCPGSGQSRSPEAAGTQDGCCSDNRVEKRESMEQDFGETPGITAVRAAGDAARTDSAVDPNAL